MLIADSEGTRGKVATSLPLALQFVPGRRVAHRAREILKPFDHDMNVRF